MYLTRVRHRLKDYAHWRVLFDANMPMLEKAGVTGTWIVQSDADPNDVTVINTWPERKNWDAFIAMHNFTGKDDVAAMYRTAGIIGEPEFFGGEVS